MKHTWNCRAVAVWMNRRTATSGLPGVLAEHSDSIRVLHTLKPLGVAMAGKDVYDPFKD